jgi:hypothetical protein
MRRRSGASVSIGVASGETPVKEGPIMKRLTILAIAALLLVSVACLFGASAATAATSPDVVYIWPWTGEVYLPDTGEILAAVPKGATVRVGFFWFEPGYGSLVSIPNMLLYSFTLGGPGGVVADIDTVEGSTGWGPIEPSIPEYGMFPFNLSIGAGVYWREWSIEVGVLPRGAYALHFNELIRNTVVDLSLAYEGQTTPTKLTPDMSGVYDTTFKVK